MSLVHEPTNEQLYETYPSVHAPAHTVARRADQTLDARLDRIEDALVNRRPTTTDRPSSGPALALAIVSLVMGVPLTGISLSSNLGSFGSLLMVMVVWFGIVGVNVAFALSRHRSN